jgi:large conductance mechanosensitive channel
VDFSEFYVLLQQGATAGPYATLAAAKEAGAVTLNWGIFVNALISFVIVAFALFMVVKSFNKMKAQQEAEETAPEAPPEPSAEETLLTEIRDLMKAKA